MSDVEKVICNELLKIFGEVKSPYKVNECICKNCKTENKEWIEVLKSWDDWGICKKCKIKCKLNK